MKLSVIIVSYNVCHYLCQCLDAVWRAAQVADVETEVFVVDNHSKDGTIALLSREYPLYLQEKGANNCRLHLIANHVMWDLDAPTTKLCANVREITSFFSTPTR